MRDTVVRPPASPSRARRWHGPASAVAFDARGIARALRTVERECHVLDAGTRLGVSLDPGDGDEAGSPLTVLAVLPPIAPGQLGAESFRRDHGLTCAYMAGAMAKGIATEEMVIALGREGLLGSFGAGGLPLARTEQAIQAVQRALPHGPYAFNLLYSPKEPHTETNTVELYLKHGVRTVEASSYLQLTPGIVRYRAAGLAARPDGSIAVGNRVIAKLSRLELAAQFMQPAPSGLLAQLLDSRLITPEQARLASQVPVADDITVEADSAGHTDNRPLVSLLPAMLAYRDELARQGPHLAPVRIGAAGGIATPQAVLGAFMMGADYVVTGSINQSAVEAGTSPAVKRLLAGVGLADVAMAPESDLFEQGFRVQVVRQGSLFPMRAQKLYDTYRKYEGIHAIPPSERLRLEQQIFKDSLDNIWRQTAEYFAARNPAEIARAEDPKVKMALVFRWYLGQTSRWAVDGAADRQLDYQIWCGPAMGAFNQWARGSYMETPENRRVADLARVLLSEAGYLYRLQWLRTQGLSRLVSH